METTILFTFARRAFIMLLLGCCRSHSRRPGDENTTPSFFNVVGFKVVGFKVVGQFVVVAAVVVGVRVIIVAVSCVFAVAGVVPNLPVHDVVAIVRIVKKQSIDRLVFVIPAIIEQRWHLVILKGTV